MSAGWVRASVALVLAGLVHGQSVETAQQAFERHDYRAALDAARGIDDPLSRAEWEFQVLYAAGDLPSALASAQRGLQAARGHLGLLQNALNCTLSLGLAPTSQKLLEQWGQALEQAPLEPAQRAAGRDRWQRFAQEVELQVRLDHQAQAARLRARGVVIALLGAALVGLVALTRPR